MPWFAVKLGKQQLLFYDMIIDFQDLSKIRKKHSGQKIVLGAGSFDLPHAGHVLFLEDCKKLGDILVVMVGSDQSIRKLKGDHRPIMNQHLRLKLVDSLKPVDYSFIDPYVDRDDLKSFLLDETFKFLKPDIHAVNDDRNDASFRMILGKKHGVDIVVLPRTAPKEFEGVSTTKLIERASRLHKKS